MARTDLIGQIVGVAAATGRECNDGRDAFHLLAGQCQRTPGAGRMPENHRAVLPDKGLAAQIIQCRNDCLGCGASGAGIVGPVAIALVLEIPPPGRAMARAFRHQHRKSPRDQKGRQRAVSGLRHLRATQHVLRRGVRNQRKPKRPIAGRAKQYRARRCVRIGRGDEPLLHAIRLAFRPWP